MTMYELDYDHDRKPETEPTVVNIPTDSGRVRLELPPDATSKEVAALITAVATRFEDSADSETTSDTETDRWRLSGRLRARRRYDLPRECRRGGEWTAAARCPNA